MIKSFICKIKEHAMIPAGACPFTGKTYNVCSRCNKMIAKQ